MHEYQEEAADMELIDAGDEFSILGELEGYWLVRTQHGRTGWLQIPSEFSTQQNQLQFRRLGPHLFAHILFFRFNLQSRARGPLLYCFGLP